VSSVTPGKNRQVTVFAVLEVTTGRWVCRQATPLRADTYVGPARVPMIITLQRPLPLGDAPN